MTTPEKAEPERSAISSTDCRHCLTHPHLGDRHTDGKCCLCGITREELEKPGKRGLQAYLRALRRLPRAGDANGSPGDVDG
jgi:hypothetical protein